MKNDFSLKAFAAGILAAFVGFASSFAIVVQGLYGVGATTGEAASGLMALSVSMGLCGIFLAFRTGMPVSAAWSTPGAAFLATLTPLEGGFSVAIGAFIVTAALIIVTGLCKPVGRAISAIPNPLANAMLAGVLLPLCLAPFEAVVQFPALGLPVVLVWAVVARLNRLFAVPAAVFVAAVLIATRFHFDTSGFDTTGFDTTGVDTAGLEFLWPAPVLVAPKFTAEGVVGIALPLFVITMASQNITGMAVLRSFGYQPNSGAMFGWTGLFSLASAPFGGHAVNLAAITTAICAGDQAHPDPKKTLLGDGCQRGGLYCLWPHGRRNRGIFKPVTANIGGRRRRPRPVRCAGRVAGLRLVCGGRPGSGAYHVFGYRVRHHLVWRQRRFLGASCRRRGLFLGSPAAGQVKLPSETP